MSNFCLENRISFKIAKKYRNFSKICLKKSKFFENLLGKIESCCEIAGKSKFLRNLPGKIDFFLSGPLQISNQIDAAACKSASSVISKELIIHSCATFTLRR